ncbi:MAG: MMPL family transporter [Treponema sp.]|nr:MMPL family transporter [Treponema sp.]
MKFLKAFFRHPTIIVVLCLAVTGFFGFFLKDLSLSNSTRMFFPQKDESYTRLTDTEETFGSMLSIGISLEAKEGTILTPEYIEVVRKITDRVYALKDVEDIDSFTDIDYVCDQDGSISATQLIPETYTGSPEDIAQLSTRLSEWDSMYNRVIVNDTFTGTQIAVSLCPKGDEQIAFDKAKENLDAAQEAFNAENNADTQAALATAKKEYKDAKRVLRFAPPDSERQQKVLEQVKEITNEECKGHELIYKFYGDPVISVTSKEFMVSDLLGLIPLVVVIVILTLYFSFHTFTGTFLPLLTVLMSTAISCGMMGMLHITFSLVSRVIPVALIAVGSAYGIHVLTHYYVELTNVEGDVSREQQQEAIFKGLREVWKAVLLAGLTTIVGFVSLVTSPIEPLHSFAIFTAIGVALALFFSVTFIPALLLMLPCKEANKKRRMFGFTDMVKRQVARAQQMRGGRSAKEASGDTLYIIYRFFCGSWVRLIITSLFIIVLSFTGLSKLKIDTSLIGYFPKSSQMRKDIDYVNEEFAGTNSVYFNIEGKEKGDITNPELLVAVDHMQQYLQNKYDIIGKMVCLNDFIKRINQVWHAPSDTGHLISSEQSDFDTTESLDSWGDIGFEDSEEDATLDSWGSSFEESSSSDAELDSWGSEFIEEESVAETQDSDYEDPNIIYSQRLSETLTARQLLDLMNQAYIAAGGKYATLDKMIDYLMGEINYNGMAYYEIPYNPEKYPVATREQLSEVVSNYLTLLSGSLERFIDDDMNPKTMRITCQLRTHSTELASHIINDAKLYAAEHFPAGYTLEATGTGEMEYTMTSLVVKSQFSSLLVSLLSVFIIITISFKSGWAGILGAVPLAFAILLNYMTMGFAKINLDLITSIIASVTVGVGIDYTIHFLTTYREERSKTNNLEEVTKQTFKKSGHGILTNALAVGLGFLVLCLSKFVVLKYIGILVAIVMFTSAFLAMTVIPGVLNLTDPTFMHPEDKKK